MYWKHWDSKNGYKVGVEIPNVGQIYSIAVNGNTLFTGNQDGSLSALKVESARNSISFKFASSAIIHSEEVTCLKIGARKRLFTASKDNTVKVWDAETLKSICVLEGHTQEVTSLLCFDHFLISCSSDGDINIWNDMEQVYEHQEEAGVVTMNGVTDVQGKPLLVCALADEIARVYELPFLEEKGTIFSKHGVHVIEMGPSGMFFTRDGRGSLAVWNMEETKSN